MDSSTAFEIYLPDRSPTWLDLIAAISGLVMLGIWLQSFSPSSLLVVALGFVGAAILIGPVSQTRVGKRIGAWSTEIGILGRTAVIGLVWIGTVLIFRVEAMPTALLADVGLGILLCGILGVAAHILHKRRIEGWLPEIS